MELSICAIFRDNENYLSNFLIPILKKIEKNYNIFYYFYENDSKDNTKFLLENFMKTRKGKLLCESNSIKSFPRSTKYERINHISNCRNKLLGLRSFKGEWTIILDSDICFNINIIEQFLNLDKPKDLVVLSSNGKDHVNCIKHPNCKHYYDTLAFIDQYNVLGHNYSAIHRTQCCHLSDIKDREKWFNGELVKVNSAFGGLSFYKTDIINKPELKYELVTSIDFIKNKKPLHCEHWDFNKRLRKFGNIYITPQIIVKNIEK